MVTEVDALKERNAVLAEYPLADIKDYLQWEVLRLTSPYLSPAFADAQAPLDRALTGQAELPKREQVVANAVARNLGHDLGQLYVGRYFSAQSRGDAEALLKQRPRRVPPAAGAEHLADGADEELRARRRSTRSRSSSATRTSGSTTRPSTSGATTTSATSFGSTSSRCAARWRASASRRRPMPSPTPRTRLPTAVNAGYSPDMNGIEIPAAILQPPFYDPKADAAVNYCTLGAVIGHELTHSLDWMGRLFDANGALRDWWTPADVAAFDARSKNLISQAQRLRGVAGRAPERQSVRRREPRRHRRVHARAPRAADAPEGESAGKPHDRRLQHASALLRCLVAAVGGEDPAGVAAHVRGHESASTGRVPDGRTTQQPPGLLRRASAFVLATRCGSTRRTASRCGDGLTNRDQSPAARDSWLKPFTRQAHAESASCVGT